MVGLGNPGAEYSGTRHNAGFDVLDRLARRFADPPASPAKSRFTGLLLEAKIGEERVLLLKPTTFMNLSGVSVLEALRFHKLDAKTDLLVIADDFALPCGTLRLRGFGGDGGHNGLADITRRLGSDQWPRLRVGIDAPGRIPTESYVLGHFTEEQKLRMATGLDEAAETAACWVERGLDHAMNTFNRRGAGAAAGDS
ncbi:MAG: aminoacyl-tRNA hydrolase [Planctomycetes bacterium]|nr:aminoacyl-tRNA hydrolase [Planctomycetota bacterium]